MVKPLGYIQGLARGMHSTSPEFKFWSGIQDSADRIETTIDNDIANVARSEEMPSGCTARFVAKSRGESQTLPPGFNPDEWALIFGGITASLQCRYSDAGYDPAEITAEITEVGTGLMARIQVKLGWFATPPEKSD